jgi:Holliday junction resolvase RusA-like endonuclease
MPDHKKLRRHTFVIPWDPIPLQRARFSHGNVYDSQKHLKFRYGMELQRQFEGEEMFHGPIALHMTFYFSIGPRPSKRKIEQKLLGSHIFRPDLDNLVKWVFDCCQNVVYKEDCIISYLRAKKLYDHRARTEFTITQLPR